MKSEFSKYWKKSKQPRKQRKYLANAPLHIRHRLMSANLSKDLRKRYGRRSFPLRKGDDVKIMKGEFKGKTGKIDSIDLKKLRVMIGGIYRTKRDGAKVNVYFSSSNLQVKELSLDDRKRKGALERKQKKGKVEEKDNKTKKKQEEKHKFKKLPKSENKETGGKNAP